MEFSGKIILPLFFVPDKNGIFESVEYLTFISILDVRSRDLLPTKLGNIFKLLL